MLLSLMLQRHILFLPGRGVVYRLILLSQQERTLLQKQQQQKRQQHPAARAERQKRPARW
jgi:hypothetical protein